MGPHHFQSAVQGLQTDFSQVSFLVFPSAMQYGSEMSKESGSHPPSVTSQQATRPVP